MTGPVQYHRIRSIAVPPLGAGLGGLEWNDVRPLIENALGGLPDVEVRIFEPVGAPSPAEMKNATPRPQ